MAQTVIAALVPKKFLLIWSFLSCESLPPVDFFPFLPTLSEEEKSSGASMCLLIKDIMLVTESGDLPAPRANAFTG